MAQKTGGYWTAFDLAQAELPPEITADWLAPRIRNDAQFVWEVGSLARSRLEYPLTTKPEGMDDDEIYYSLNIQIAVDYVYRWSEMIQPFDSTACVCGAELEYHPPMGRVFFSSRLRRRCVECNTPFDPRTRTSRLIDGWFGQPNGELAGGATSRFAVFIDCNKAIPRSPSVVARPELVDLLASCLGDKIDQVGTFS